MPLRGTWEVAKAYLSSSPPPSPLLVLTDWFHFKSNRDRKKNQSQRGKLDSKKSESFFLERRRRVVVVANTREGGWALVGNLSPNSFPKSLSTNQPTYLLTRSPDRFHFFFFAEDDGLSTTVTAAFAPVSRGPQYRRRRRRRRLLPVGPGRT